MFTLVHKDVMISHGFLGIRRGDYVTGLVSNSKGSNHTYQAKTRFSDDLIYSQLILYQPYDTISSPYTRENTLLINGSRLALCNSGQSIGYMCMG
jgi:hypothetical protein